MSFQPVVPLGGIAGWSFLQKTREAQQVAFAASAPVARVTEYFAERIGEVRSAEELVSDRRLLSVALGAFGLDSDIDSRFFVRKVIEDGTSSREALSNRLADKRYLALSEAFGFGDIPGGKVANSDFAEGIVSRYRTRQFEIAVGTSNPDMRLALGLERELPDLASRGLSNDGQWFTVLGTPPLRAVFEKALGLPPSIGTLDIDRQLGIFKDRAETRLGTSQLSELASPEGRAALTQKFLAVSDVSVNAPSTTRGSAALAMLSSSPVVPFAS